MGNKLDDIMVKEYKISNWEKKKLFLSIQELALLENRNDESLINILKLPFIEFVRTYLSGAKRYSQYEKDIMFPYKLYIIPDNYVKYLVGYIKGITCKTYLTSSHFGSAKDIKRTIHTPIDDKFWLGVSPRSILEETLKRYLYIMSFVTKEEVEAAKLHSITFYSSGKYRDFNMSEKLNLLNPPMRMLFEEYIGLNGKEKINCKDIAKKYSIPVERVESALNYIIPLFTKSLEEIKSKLRPQLDTENTPYYQYFNMEYRKIDINISTLFIKKNILTSDELEEILDYSEKEQMAYIGSKYMFSLPMTIANNFDVPLDFATKINPSTENKKQKRETPSVTVIKTAFSDDNQMLIQYQISEWSQKSKMLSSEEKIKIKDLLKGLINDEDAFELYQILLLPYPMFIREYFKQNQNFNNIPLNAELGYKMYFLPEKIINPVVEYIKTGYKDDTLWPKIEEILAIHIDNPSWLSFRNTFYIGKYLYILKYIDAKEAEYLKLTNPCFNTSYGYVGFDLDDKLALLNEVENKIFQLLFCNGKKAEHFKGAYRSLKVTRHSTDKMKGIILPLLFKPIDEFKEELGPVAGENFIFYENKVFMGISMILNISYIKHNILTEEESLRLSLIAEKKANAYIAAKYLGFSKEEIARYFYLKDSEADDIFSKFNVKRISLT